MAMAAHDAYLLRTEGATGDDINAVTGAIYARFGANTTIHFIYGSGTQNFNGSEIRNFGAANLERFDTASATMPVAERFFVSAENFTLASNQSIWSAGSRLVVLEFGGNVTFQAGSYVGVSAIGALGMAGGGDGGVPTPRPIETLNFRDTKQDPPGYTVGQGGTVSSIATKGEDGQRMAIYNVQVGSVQIVPENTYASSTGGGTGYIGQGDQWFLGIGLGYSGLATGGPAVLFNGAIPAGGTGGLPGLQGSSTVFGGGNGGPGNPGITGDNGTNGVAGTNGLIDTLAGSALHLRAGSGGGAGATGGFGLGAGVGGCGGGGGANGDGGLFVPVVPGGNGGKGGAGGLGGKGGVGGRGGAGGGGIQVLVRGVFNNGATWEAKGTAGLAGEAGTVGTDGAAGSPGSPGLPSLSLQSGSGGSGGPGGKGGTGGKGGNGSGGSGGNIQIVASEYYSQGAQFSVAGGGSAPAGLVQIHGFNGTSQNAPFGAFAADQNPYVSNVSLLSNPIPPTPGLKPGSTPRFPKMIGGPASYGLSDGLPSTLTQVSSKLVPPPNCDAVVFRIDAEDMQNHYANHDLLAFVNVRSGTTLPSPKIAAVDPADSAQQGTSGKVVYLPAPQPLMAGKGYLNDPLITPGGTGPVQTDNPQGKVWLTTLARDRAFEVSAQWSPYGTVRTVKGTPVRGSLYSGGIGAPVALYLNDNGNPSMVLEETTSEYPVNTPEYMLETPAERSIVRYYRQGSSPTFTFKVSNQHGNPHSRGSGNAICYGYLPNSILIQGKSKTYTNRTKTDAPVSVSVTVPTKDQPYKSEVVLASGHFLPSIDSTPHGSNVVLYGRIVGPLPSVSGLTSTPTGDTLVSPVTPPGQTGQSTFEIFNGDSLSLEWSMAVYDQPKLARLSVLSAQILNDPTGAFSLATALPSTIDLGWTKNYTVNFTPPSYGRFSATLRLRTDNLAALGQPGQIIDIPLQGNTGDFATWAASLPEGQRGANDDANHNGIPNLIEYGLNGGGQGDLPVMMPGTPSSQASFNLPQTLRPDVQWSIEGSANLASWQRVGTRHPATGTWSTVTPLSAIAEQLTGGVRRTSVTFPNIPQKYFIRLVGTQVANDYSNDFSTAASANLRGTAVWTDGAIQLSDGSPGQAGSVVLDGIAVWEGQTGFNAKFDLQMLTEVQVVGNGMTFSVGDLGTGVWGLNGPATPRNLTIGFETFYPFADPPLPNGYRLMVNGTMVASLPVYAFNSSYPVPVEVNYTPATGVTVKSTGGTIFANVAVPGFTLQPGDQFGFGTYGATPPAATRVDNVVILPR